MTNADGEWRLIDFGEANVIDRDRPNYKAIDQDYNKLLSFNKLAEGIQKVPAGTSQKLDGIIAGYKMMSREIFLDDDSDTDSD